MKKLVSLMALFAGMGFAGSMPTEHYTVEDIPLPKSVAPEIGGLACNPAGELVVVLRRSGIIIGTPHRDPKQFQWRVFSDASMHNPCGVLLGAEGDLLVPQMQELTWIKDMNGDGLADLYQAVSTAWGVSGNYHETIAGPIPDGEGNWFLAIGTASHNGPVFYNVRGAYSPIGRRGRNYSAVEYKGWVVKIRPDGSLIPWASGFRANNGMCMDPSGNLWVTDNQGDWRGTSPLYHVEEGDFCGHPSSLVWDKAFFPDKGDPLNYGVDKLDAMRKRAAVLFPQGLMANSPTEPIVDVTRGRFGPFGGQMFVGDVAGRRILRVMVEKVKGQYQGACVKFIDGSGLRGGSNRLAFGPDGNALYVGQTYRGWGGPTEGLQRIVFQDKDPFEVHSMKLTENGFRLKFTGQLDAELAKDPKSYEFKHYWFKYGHAYGSAQMDKTPVAVKSVEVIDEEMVDVVLADPLEAKKVYQLDVKVRSSNGKPVVNPTLCYTVNEIL